MEWTTEELINTKNIIGKIRDEARNTEPSERVKNDIKVRKIIKELSERGLMENIFDEMLLVETIEKYNVDVSEFDFPYGSYEKFKSVVEKEELEYNQFLKEIRESFENEDDSEDGVLDGERGFMI